MHENLFDIVFTWVDSADAEFRELISIYDPDILTRQSARYRDNNEIKYSLRGIYENVNFNNIYVVTNGQHPKFLTKTHSRVRIINHADIFLEKSHLPTFNSLAIECHLHKIPGLADNFIYLNDDLFICRKTHRDDFLGPDGKGLFHLSRSLLRENPNFGWNRLLQATERELSQKYGIMDRYSTTHTPQFFHKPTCYAVENVWRSVIEETSASKFRNNSNIFFRLLYTYYVIYERCGVNGIVEIMDNFNINQSGVNRPTKSVYRTIGYPLSTFDVEEEIILKPPLFLSIQDTGSSMENVTDPIVSLLEKIFPHSVEWEC
jgi:hypothetical protein